MELLDGKRWQVKLRVPVAYLSALPSVHPLLAQILFNRGIAAKDALELLNGHKPQDDDPFLMRDIDSAVSLIREVILNKEPIIIYGDYDVDGVTSAAILKRVLESIGAVVDVYIPNRADEGYGLNRQALIALFEDGVRLLITVDCGVRSVDEIDLAQRLGMRVIITDHHNVNDILPPADAIINPKQSGCTYPFKDFAGVGVAYKLAQALIRKNRTVPLSTTIRDIDEASLLDMVALGTVADMVPLVGENHYLVSAGLEQINAGHHAGLSALMQVVGIKPGAITAKSIGFNLSPRLNAAGRISEAMNALDLLLAPDMMNALPLAKKLDALNIERRTLTQHVRDKAREMVLENEMSQFLIFTASEDFSSGVVGLAASRLVDEFYRPAVVISIDGEYSKGSARSIPEFHITEALDAVPGLLIRHGGHAAAAGFTIQTSLLPELEHRLYDLAKAQLEGLNLIPKFAIDADVALEDLSWDVYHELQRLEPYGFGNPQPVFMSRKIHVCDARAVGFSGRHLKFTVEDKLGTRWDAIAFQQGYWDGRIPTYVDIAYLLERNEWNGRIKLQLNVKDIHFSL
ncbi:MAG: single-stranded-DNA-specific exonuclease RecJ [Anaerolineae bacterium]|nr:single-stranded-DNA-specific exonuclease RecJ [Anaerolineae bacterium]